MGDDQKNEILIQAAEMCFLRRVIVVSRRNRMRSSAIQEGLGLELMLLCVERRQVRWFGLLVRMPPGLLSEVFQAVQPGGSPTADPGPGGEIISLYLLYNLPFHQSHL